MSSSSSQETTTLRGLMAFIAYACALLQMDRLRNRSCVDVREDNLCGKLRAYVEKFLEFIFGSSSQTKTPTSSTSSEATLTSNFEDISEVSSYCSSDKSDTFSWTHC